ncbi:hypothetical protein NDJ01_23460 [Vibrio sp. HS-50-1]|uniref:hypothetical protein n=1 Tax=Vibrio sp. HS-50-1 TaxID=2945079 RepID=UPI002160EAC6|nr:hypothetical protein [Vibrio sp. HS-50-1]MCS0207151.1 hypothetical protein [Vibrio sp. HS-50-1]
MARYTGNTAAPIVEPKEAVEDRSFLAQLKDGMQAESWVKPFDIQNAQPRATIYDPNYDVTKNPRYNELRDIDKDAIVKVATAYSDEDFEYKLDRQKATQEARERLSREGLSGGAASVLGAILSPETFVPVAGTVGKMRSAAEMVKFAKQANRMKAAMVAKDVAANMALAGSIAAMRESVDSSYSVSDAAFDTLAAGAFATLGEGFTAYKASKRGKALDAQHKRVAGIEAKLAINAKASEAAKVAQDVAGMDIVQRSLDVDAAPKYVPVPERNLSMKELRQLRDNRLSRSELRQLERDVARMSRQGDEAGMDVLIEGKRQPIALDVLKEKLTKHKEALEAEQVMEMRSMGMPDNTSFKALDAERRNLISKSMDETFELLSKRSALERLEGEGACKALYDDYQAKLQAKVSQAQAMWQRAERSRSTLAKERSAILKQVNEGVADARKRRFRKPSKLASSTLNLASDYGRAMRSDNEAYRSLMSRLLQDSSNGGRSAASVAEFNAEDMVKLLDRSISPKDLSELKMDLRKKDPSVKEADVLKHISDLVEGYEMPSSEAATRVRDAFRKFYADAAERLRAYNPNIELASNDGYMRRMVDFDAVHKAAHEGQDEVIMKALYKGMKKAQWNDLVKAHGEEGAETLLNAAARGYWKKLKRVAGFDADEDAALDALVKDGHFLNDLSPEELSAELDQDAIGRLAGDKAAKNNKPDFLKTRMKLRLDVQEGDFDLRSLFERDAARVATKYARDTSSWMGLASQGIYTPKDLAEMLQSIRRGSGSRSGATDDYERAMKYVALLKGVPIHKDTVWTNTLRGLMSYQFITKMGAAPIMALFEQGRVASMMGVDTVRNLPFVRNAISGLHKLTKSELVQMGDDLQAIMPHHYQPSRYFSRHMDMAEEQWAGAFSAKMRDYADLWGRLNGMEQIDRNLRASAIDVFHNRLVGHVLEGKKLGNLIDLEYLGIDDKTLLELKKAMRSSTEVKHDLFGEVYSVNFDKWPSALRLRYKEALQTAGNRMIQKAYLGEGFFATGHPLAQVFMQFRNFGLTSIGKQFGADLMQAQKQGLGGYATMGGAWLTMGVFTVLGIETRKELLSVGTDEDPEFNPEEDWATWWRYHPALGWTRDVVDVVGGTADYFGLIEKSEMDEALGVVQRSSGLTNRGLFESTPVGSMLTKDIPAAFDEPSVETISKFAPDAVYTRWVKNLIQD